MDSNKLSITVYTVAILLLFIFFAQVYPNMEAKAKQIKEKNDSYYEQLIKEIE